MRQSHVWSAPLSIMAAVLVLGAGHLASAHDTSHGPAGGSVAGDAMPSHESQGHEALAHEAPPNETPFLEENERAMAKMMADMAVKPSGDIDRDFVAMMVPHHQGAIDMAVAVLRRGHNEQLKRLAQEIIVTQQQEIVAMRLAIGEALPASAPAPTQPSLRDAGMTLNQEPRQ